MTIQHLIITGASGYIGNHLIKFARERGIAITVLGRRPVANVRMIEWSLPMPLPETAIDPGIPLDQQALIHLAHDWRVTDGSLNTEGTRSLLTSGRAIGLKHFVFASSQSARSDAANHYGRIKWTVEQELIEPGEVSARIGVIYGGIPQAQYGLLCRLASLSPVLPMIEPLRLVQTIHITEVCDGLLKLAERNDTGWFGFGSPTGIAFGDVLKTLAKELYGKRLKIVSVPLQFALTSADLINRLPFGPAVDRERILGLAGTLPMASRDHLISLGLTIEPFAQRLRREPMARKAALREAKLVLGFVVKRPGSALLRRYAKALDRSDPPGVLALPRRSAISTRIEPIGAGSILTRRLRLATALIEADPISNIEAGRTATFIAASLDVLSIPLRLASGALYR